MFTQVSRQAYEQAINTERTNQVNLFQTVLSTVGAEARPIITLAVPLISGLISSRFFILKS